MLGQRQAENLGFETLALKHVLSFHIERILFCIERIYFRLILSFLVLVGIFLSNLTCSDMVKMIRTSSCVQLCQGRLHIRAVAIMWPRDSAIPQL